MLPDDSFIVKLLCIYRFYPDSIDLNKNLIPLRAIAQVLGERFLTFLR